MIRRVTCAPIVLGLVWTALVGGPAQATSIFQALRGINLAAFVSVSARQPGTMLFYVNNGPMCTAAFADQLASSGLEFVRLVISPLPLMQADKTARSQAIDALTECGDRLVSSGLAVIYDMHFWSPNNDERQREALTKQPQSELFHSGLVALAQELVKRPQDTVALELLNEPPRCEAPSDVDWRPIQLRFVTDIRRVAAELPLVLTGCGGPLEPVFTPNNEPDFSDPKLIYTVHFYEPFIYTHQFTWSGGVISDLVYPPDVANAEAVIREHLSRLEAAPLPEVKKTIIAGDLRKYLRADYGAANIASRFRVIDNWAKQHNIPAERIFLGEFGASIGFPFSKATDEIRASELRWIKDVRQTSEMFRYKYAYWMFPRSNMYAFDTATRFLKPEFLTALGLRPPRGAVRP